MGKIRTNVLAKWTQVWVSSPAEDSGASSGALPAEGWGKLALGCAGLGAVSPFCFGETPGELAPGTAVMLALGMLRCPGVQTVEM